MDGISSKARPDVSGREAPIEVVYKPVSECTYIGIQKVEITIERFVRNGQLHYLFFTRDEESAMLLKSVFLPGQQKEVQMATQRAFAKGFWSAIQF